MKRFANAVPFLALLIAPLPASADHIGVYTDESGSYCHLEVAPGQQVSVYVVHIYTLGARGSTFAVIDDTGFVRLAEVRHSGFFSSGSVYSGVVVSYFDCQVGHAAPFRLDFFTVDPRVDPCAASLRVVGNPLRGDASPVVQDCTDLLHPATGGEFVFGPAYCSGCSANPTQDSTWGKVKALYR